METPLEPGLPICDPHHHLWNRTASRYLFEELEADTTSGHNVVSTVFIECMSAYLTDGPEELKPVGETAFVTAADPSGLVGGIVGFADLFSPQIDDVLAAHIEAGAGRFRGIRYQVAQDPSPEIANALTATRPGIYAEPAFRRGFSALGRAGLSFDSWQYHPQLNELVDLARDQPQVLIVVDHLGTPIGVGPYRVRHEETLEQWRQSMRRLAECENVYLKLGGLGMTIFGQTWHYFPGETTSEQIADVWGSDIRWCIEQFGPSRCMFESNFPVDKISCSYQVLWNAFKRIAADYSATEKAALFHDTAHQFYRL